MSTSFSDDDSIGGTTDEESLPIKQISSKSTSATKLEFTDVVDTLTAAIDGVQQLEEWKKKALKAERLSKQLKTELDGWEERCLTSETQNRRLNDELADTKDEVAKWKKRAVRAEKENQEEIVKWKKRALRAKNGEEDIEMETRDDDGADSFTDLVSHRGHDDSSTISTRSTQKDKRKDENDKVSNTSFRSKWSKIPLEEPKTDENANDDDPCISPEEVLKTCEKDFYKIGSKREQQDPEDDNSTAVAEEILNNYLGMKGRLNNRRFDTGTKKISKQQFEI